MSNVRVVTIASARPQFVKAATVSRAIAAWNRTCSACHIVEQIILAAVSAAESSGAILPPDRPSDLYGDGRSALRIVALLGGDIGEGGDR